MTKITTDAKATAPARSAAAGCFVNSASGAYQYYAENQAARSKAVAKFESRVITIVQKPTRATAAKKTSRSSA